MQWKRLFATLGLGMLLVLAACSKGAGSASTVRVTMDEWGLKPSVASVRAGQVSFEAVNKGKVEHELVILKTDLGTKALKMRTSNAHKAGEDASGTNGGEIEDVGSGETKTETFDLKAGHYVLLCNVEGHYEEGMVSELTVK